MIISPQQLRAIVALSEERALESVELIALPLRIQTTINFKDGTWTTKDIDLDGVVKERV